MNAGVSASNLLMQFLIRLASSVFVLRVRLTTLRIGGGGGRGAASGEPSLYFIASHCQVGRLQPSSGLLMGVGVLFLQQIYVWVGHCDLQGSDTVSAAGTERLTVALRVCSRWVRCTHRCPRIEQHFQVKKRTSCDLRHNWWDWVAHQCWQEVFSLTWSTAEGMTGGNLLPQCVFKYREKIEQKNGPYTAAQQPQRKSASLD